MKSFTDRLLEGVWVVLVLAGAVLLGLAVALALISLGGG